MRSTYFIVIFADFWFEEEPGRTELKSSVLIIRSFNKDFSSSLGIKILPRLSAVFLCFVCFVFWYVQLKGIEENSAKLWKTVPHKRQSGQSWFFCDWVYFESYSKT